MSHSTHSSQRRLSESFDIRLILALIGAIIILISVFLPLFSNKIVSSVTYYTGDTITSEFPGLIWDQQYRENRPPTRQEFERSTFELAPTNIGNGSGWSWLKATIVDKENRPQLTGNGACLAIIVLNAIAAIAFAIRDLLTDRPLHPILSRWIFYWSILAMLAVPAVLLYQFDFSQTLLKAYFGQIGVGIGLWGMGLGSLLILISIVTLFLSRRISVSSWWLLVFLAAMTIWALTKFRPAPFSEILDFLSDGIVTTLRITATSFIFIVLAGLLGGLGRISSNPIIHGIASLYVEIVRGIPLMVQLLFIWFALPQVYRSLGPMIIEKMPFAAGFGQWLIDLKMSPFTAAIVGLTVCYGAYMSEIFRAGIASISRGQMEAARSLGMSYFQAMRYVILPQAVRVILPPVGNEFVALLKDSAMVSVLAVPDLTRRGREYMARTFLSLETWGMVALIYLVMTLFASRIVSAFEEKASFEK